MQSMGAPCPEAGALQGVLVADFSRVLAGPYLTLLLADLGATVVKVEGPDGDGTRRWGPPWHAGSSTYFRGVNRGKRSVTLDLREEDDRKLARELALRADVLVQNLLPGGMEKFALGYEQLHPINPMLVYCSISGFGSQPGGAKLPGYDLLGQAVSGLMSITGPPAGPPYKAGAALVDVLCGLHGAVGVLAALNSREQTGLGQHVEVDLMSSALSALTNQAAGYLLAGVAPRPMGNAHPSVAPYEVLRAADGDLVLAIGTDGQFRRLCSELGREHLADDPRFCTNAARVEHREALIHELHTLLRGLRRDEIGARLNARGVPCGPVNDIGEAFAYAKAIGLEPTWDIDGDRYVRAPMKLSFTSPRPGLPAPAQDEHGPAVRAWLRGPEDVPLEP
jgi:crotonobetainyl-CoA:carnitine CoA-transferase CaiB-like acyl-CoA transferase